MPRTHTAGGQRLFDYEGTIETGVNIIFATLRVHLPRELFTAVLEQFRGQVVVGGFSMDDPPEGGIGHFIREWGNNILGRSISPRYGSHLVAILRDRGLVQVDRGRNKMTMVTFPK